MADLLTALCQRLETSLDRSGRAHAVCPFCGIAPGYHFYLFDMARGRGYVCWSCGAKGTLSDLARELSVQGTERPYTPRPAPAIPAAPWTHPGALEAYRATVKARWVDVVTAWQTYKPLTEETIRRADLGLGLLPLYSEDKGKWYQMRRPRLLAPLIQGGRMVGVAGRALPGDDGPKWITASTSRLILHGLEEIRVSDTVIWCENRVDRLLIEQTQPGVRAVASGGLTWQYEWLVNLKQRRPAHVLIWFDNDVSGCPCPATYIQMRAEWEATMRERVRQGKIARMPEFQEPRGPKLANELLALGVPATIYRWPNGTPAKYDIGSAIAAEMRMGA